MIWWILGALVVGFVVGFIAGIIYVNVSVMNALGRHLGW